MSAHSSERTGSLPVTFEIEKTLCTHRKRLICFMPPKFIEASFEFTFPDLSFTVEATTATVKSHPQSKNGGEAGPDI